MSESNRKRLMRILLNTRKHTSTIDYYLEEVQQACEQSHPDLAKHLQVIRDTNKLTDELVMNFREAL